MSKVIKKSKYWDCQNLINTGADIMCAIGQRGNGKSYSVLRYFLREYHKSKKRFCYIRRWVDDIKGFRAEQLFSPLQSVIEELFGDGYTVLYYRHKYYLVNPDGVKVDIIGYALALSESSHTKSVSFVGVYYILFDEIIQMAGESTLRDEKLKYENTISTICRDRTDEIKIFLIGNTVSKFSWIFIYLGIDINKVEQGQTVVKEYPLDDDKGILRVALEYCEYNEEVGKKTSKYTTSDMIKSGKWEIAPCDDIPTVVGEIVKDRLLFTIYDADADVIIGCFLRHSKWATIELDEDTMLKKYKSHFREFLVLKTTNVKSSYFHLSNQKSLNHHTYNDMSYMLRDIKDATGIDFTDELYSGRIFCDNMFTKDFFNHAYITYNRVTTLQLL